MKAQMDVVEPMAEKAKVDALEAEKAKVDALEAEKAEVVEEKPFPFLFKKMKGLDPEEQKNIWSEIFHKTGWFYGSGESDELMEISRDFDEIPGDELYPDQLGLLLNWLSESVKNGTVNLSPEIQEDLIASYEGKH